MKITRLKIANYKSFDETPELTFTSGFNIVAGQNNTGKTALLEVLNLTFGPRPHRSLKTLPTRETIVDPLSVAHVSVTLTRDEVLAILGANGGNFIIALPHHPSDFSQRVGYNGNSVSSVANVIRHVLSQPELTFSASLRKNGNPEWVIPRAPSYGLYSPQQPSPQQFNSGIFALGRDGQPTDIRVSTASADNEIGAPVMAALPRRIFRFSAERLNVGTCPFGPRVDLLPNASNLAEVLSSLQHNPVRFAEFNSLVHQILPQVRHVTVRPLPNNEVQIVVWPHEPESQREDVAIPLDQCGTGIGQVLAILYVAVHAPFPRVILIDEPQSFLHPGAARKLIEVLGNYRQHQFIVSTHSPTVITAADPENMIVTRLESGVTKLAQIHPRDDQAMQSFLSEIGVRLSDVFGADNVLWVEGTTEEVCFPLILRRIANRPILGTTILGVRRTGDLERKDAARIFEIYGSLTMSGALIPPAVAFVLDRECRTALELEDIRKRSNGLAVFLQRRMYENYLLNPEAIVHVATAIDGFGDRPLSVEEVRAAIGSRRKDRKYYCTADSDEMSDERWFKHVHAAVLLSDIFSDLSEKRVAYDKVVHSVALTRWLIDNSPGDLKELSDMLAFIFDRQSDKTGT